MKKQYQEKDTLFNDVEEVMLPTTLAAMSSSVMNALYHQTKKMMGKMVDYKELKDTLVDELRKCAETISQTDYEMMEIRSKMEKLIDVPSEEEILLARMRKLDIPIE